ncbi:chaperone J-domain-containing protein, partial [Neocallimastix californiae]
MKINSFLILIIFFIIFLCKVQAWEEKDFEIFDAHDAITRLKGPDATFYNVLQVEPNASVDVLNKAYRKISLSLHPDKTTDKKDRELYTQINLIINILRDKNARKRYDYFLKVGVPKWRGTGYFFSRYKPSIRFAVIAIVSGICIMQILLSWTNYHTKKYRIN